MRVDLGLEGFQLQVLNLTAMFHPFFHQGIHLIHHLVEAAHKLGDLIVARWLQAYCHIPFFHRLHGSRKLGNALQGGLADQVCKQIGGKGNGEDEDKHFNAHLPA